MPVTLAPGAPPATAQHKAREGHELLDHQALHRIFTVTERFTGLGFQAMAVTLQRQACQDANHADGEAGQAQAEHSRNDQQEADDKQRHGNQVQRQVGRVLMVLWVVTPLPGGEIGVTFAHGGESSVR